MGEHVHVHRRHALEHRRAVGLDAREHLGGVEARMQHQRHPVQNGAVDHDVAVDVRTGQGGDDRVELRLAGASARSWRRSAAPRDATASRPSGGRSCPTCSRSSRAPRARPARDRSPRSRRCSSSNGVAPATGSSPNTMLSRPATPASSAGPIFSGLPINAFAPQSRGHVGHLGRRQHDVDRVDDGAGLQRAVVADDPFPAVRRVERDAVAGPTPRFARLTASALDSASSSVNENERSPATRARRSPKRRAAWGRTSPSEPSMGSSSSGWAPAAQVGANLLARDPREQPGGGPRRSPRRAFGARRRAFGARRRALATPTTEPTPARASPVLVRANRPRDGANPGRPRASSSSGRPDSNRRPPAPKAGALPGCATPRGGEKVRLPPGHPVTKWSSGRVGRRHGRRPAAPCPALRPGESGLAAGRGRPAVRRDRPRPAGRAARALALQRRRDRPARGDRRGRRPVRPRRRPARPVALRRRDRARRRAVGAPLVEQVGGAAVAGRRPRRSPRAGRSRRRCRASAPAARLASRGRSPWMRRGDPRPAASPVFAGS